MFVKIIHYQQKIVVLMVATNQFITFVRLIGRQRIMYLSLAVENYDVGNIILTLIFFVVLRENNNQCRHPYHPYHHFKHQWKQHQGAQLIGCAAFLLAVDFMQH